jgi:hypothetical protein
VEQVPQGYAYGIWSWLEKRFQSTEQDNVGDLWEEFTTLSMDEDEFFDVYKARVDRVFGLLAHAKDKPSPWPVRSQTVVETHSYIQSCCVGSEGFWQAQGCSKDRLGRDRGVHQQS